MKKLLAALGIMVVLHSVLAVAYGLMDHDHWYFLPSAWVFAPTLPYWLKTIINLVVNVNGAVCGSLIDPLWGPAIGVLLQVVVSAAVLEELEFRSWFRFVPQNQAIIFWSLNVLGATIFALGHLNRPVIFLLPVFVLAMLNSWMTWRTGNVWRGVALHAMCNLYAVTALCCDPRGLVGFP